MDNRQRRFYEWFFLKALGKPPFPYQEAILSHSGPLVINKARQTGISTAMACMAVCAAALGDQKVLICSNKEENAKHLLQYAWAFIHPLVDSGVVKTPGIDQAGFIRWDSGGEIRCQAASRDAGRGYPVDLAIMDELAHFTKEIDLDRQMIMSVRGTLAQTGGRLVLLSTPNGTKNEFYKAFEASQERHRMTIHWSQCPTLKIREETLPFGKQYWVGDAPTPMPEMDFRQEFANDFYIGSDEAISMDALRASITNEEPPSGMQWIVLGVDVGRERDAYAPVGAGLAKDSTIWFIEAAAFYQKPFNEQTTDLGERVKRHSPNRIVMDKTFNPQSTEEAGRLWPSLVEPFIFGEQSKRDLIAKANSFFTAARVKCPSRLRQIIDEISNIRKVVGDSGNVLYKDKPHGDVGWAGLLALWGIHDYQTTAGLANLLEEPCPDCNGSNAGCRTCDGRGKVMRVLTF